VVVVAGVAGDLRSWKFFGEAVYDFVHAPPALYCGELQQFWVVFGELFFCHCQRSFCHGLEGRDLCRAAVCTFACVAGFLRSWKFCGEAVYDFVHAPPALYCGELQQFWVAFGELFFCHCHRSACHGLESRDLCRAAVCTFACASMFFPMAYDRPSFVYALC